MTADRNARRRAIGKTAKAARRRQVAAMNRIRELAVLDADRMRLRASLVEAELAVALGEGAGTDMTRYRAEVDHLHAVVADLDRQVDEARIAAGLPAEGMPRREVCPVIDLHLDEIGLGEIRR